MGKTCCPKELRISCAPSCQSWTCIPVENGRARPFGSSGTRQIRAACASLGRVTRVRRRLRGPGPPGRLSLPSVEGTCSGGPSALSRGTARRGSDSRFDLLVKPGRQLVHQRAVLPPLHPFPLLNCREYFDPPSSIASGFRMESKIPEFRRDLFKLAYFWPVARIEGTRRPGEE